jgi:hypothetical protein
MRQVVQAEAALGMEEQEQRLSAAAEGAAMVMTMDEEVGGCCW